jgi:hypothetical protein
MDGHRKRQAAAEVQKSLHNNWMWDSTAGVRRLDCWNFHLKLNTVDLVGKPGQTVASELEHSEEMVVVNDF